jgi:class 3 adenylate cyclase
MSGETVTCVVMFADVAGSTAIYENLGDELARERISNSLNTLISTSTRHGGSLVKTIGDEILVYFLDVDQAMFAAREIQEVMEDDRSPETIGVSIRIGMQYGSAILENDDIFGDTVNVAARIASMAKARQILCTKELAFMLKETELANNVRPFDRLRVKGRQEPVDIYIYVWEEEEDMTNMAARSSFTNPGKHHQAKTVTLTYEECKHVIPNSTTSYILGRGGDCELVILGELISRYHSKIEYRRGKFVISDQSTNGTFIKTMEGQEIFLRREEFALFGSGYVSLGKEVDFGAPDLIHFQCE